MSNKILYSQSTQTTYGYNRLDDENPVGLDPDLLVLTRVETEPPEITATQSLSSNYVVDVDSLEYRQQWSVVDNPPKENWDDFNEALLSDPVLNQAIGTVFQVAPAISLALPTALDQVARNGVASFKMVFNPFCQFGQVSAEQRGLWADMAVDKNLPADFVAVVRGD